jgi:hypothetical protein
MYITSGAKFEAAVRLLSERMPLAKDLIKPTLFHSIRVGVYLYEHGYFEDIVLAGLLHDSIEDTNIDEALINTLFGSYVSRMVEANTKRENEDIESLIDRCVDFGEDALIVKSADILDNYRYYLSIDSKEGVDYCLKNAKAIIDLMPGHFDDKVYEKLKVLL